MKTWSVNERLRSTDLNANFAEGISKATPQTVTAGHTWSAIQTFSAGLSVTTGGITVTAGGLTVSAGTTAVQALTAAGGVTVTTTGAGISLVTSASGAATYIRLNNTAETGGKDWRVGYSGGSGGSASSFDLYNNTDSVMAMTLTSTGAVTFAAGVTATTGTFGGANAASIGAIRIPNGSAIYSRNDTNTGDFTMMNSVANTVSIGAGATSVDLPTKLGLLAAASAGSGSDVYLGGTTQTTIGANGGASALTALPLGYLIAYKGATKIVIPYYNG